jgi:hypothetical protein
VTAIGGTFKDLLDRLRPTLQDDAQDRHTDAKLFGYAVDGVREAALRLPHLFSFNSVITAIAGVEQRVDAWFLVDVFGTRNGDAIQFADYETFTRFTPNWRRASSGPAEIWMRLPTDPGHQPNEMFYLWPPQKGGEVIELCVCGLDLTQLQLGSEIPLPNVYHAALEMYVLGRAELEDDEHAVDQRAQVALNAFAAALGAGDASEKTPK